jgi:GNAT superfamily N-acetyltransferase
MTIFDASRIDIYDLVGTTVTAPPDYDLVPMDARHALQLDHDLEPHALQVFDSPERFEREGMGYAVVTHPGGTVVSAATSYTMSARRLEVAIATRPEHRGRGLAEVAASALVYHALDACIVPE